MSKHTPGPWVVYDDSKDGKTNRIEIAALGKTVAHIYSSVPKEDVPNARLISAAPELLKELHWMRNLWQKEKNNHVGLINANGAEVFEWIDRVDAAIAKATGETK
jgi:hypothetical protein